MSEKVLETQDYLDVITSVSNEAIFITDESGFVEYANEHFLSLFWICRRRNNWKTNRAVHFFM
jgi:PAS domain-containing protein